MSTKISKLVCGLAISCSLIAAPTAAIASQPVSVSPLVALSMVASPQSQSALCAVGAAGAAEAAAAATQAPAQGCVLPVPDAAVTPLPEQAVVNSPNFSPLLIGLGAIGLGVLLYALLHDDEDEEPPVPEQPMSPM